MAVVLDSSALFEMQDLPEDDCVTVPGVWVELRRHKDPRIVYWEGILRTSSPGPDSVDRVRSAALHSGDAGRLSETDVELLALALEMGSPLLSDDYSMQNIARLIGVECSPVATKGIKKVWRWSYRCTGCGKAYGEDKKECDVCGHSLKSVRKR